MAVAWVLTAVLLAQVDGGVDRVEAERVMTETPPIDLIGRSRVAVKNLGPYRYRMVKQERVKGDLLAAQTVDVFVEESPFSVRLHFVDGPAKGRKVLYNSKAKADSFRVREAGVLSILGALSIGVDSSLARSDSNHSVKEAGMGNLLERFGADLKKAETVGGMTISQEGWNGAGHWCAMYVAPNGGKGFASAKSRICTDVDKELPAKVESFDTSGNVMERYEFSQVKSETQTKGFYDLGEF